jgi:hypothetical protein
MQTPKKRSVETKTVSKSGPNYDLAGKMKTVSKDGEVVKTKIKRTITPTGTGTGKPMTTVSVTKGSGPDAPTRSRRGIIPVKAKYGMSMKPTMMRSGGFPITEKAAARKEAKGKGRIGYKYGSNTDSPGTGNNKGSYVGFSREARKSDGPFKSMKDSKPARPIMKKGGTKKK